MPGKCHFRRSRRYFSRKLSTLRAIPWCSVATLRYCKSANSSATFLKRICATDMTLISAECDRRCDSFSRNVFWIFFDLFWPRNMEDRTFPFGTYMAWINRQYHRIVMKCSSRNFWLRITSSWNFSASPPSRSSYPSYGPAWVSRPHGYECIRDCHRSQKTNRTATKTIRSILGRMKNACFLDCFLLWTFSYNLFIKMFPKLKLILQSCECIRSISGELCEIKSTGMLHISYIYISFCMSNTPNMALNTSI